MCRTRWGRSMFSSRYEIAKRHCTAQTEPCVANHARLACWTLDQVKVFPTFKVRSNTSARGRCCSSGERRRAVCRSSAVTTLSGWAASSVLSPSKLHTNLPHLPRAAGTRRGKLVEEPWTKRGSRSTTGPSNRVFERVFHTAFEAPIHERVVMHKSPESIEQGAKFTLASVEQELRAEPQYTQSGHTSRTLVRANDQRVVLSVLAAEARIPQHQAPGTVSIHVLSGTLRLALPVGEKELNAGELLVLEGGLPHDVVALSDAAFLLTLAWR